MATGNVKKRDWLVIVKRNSVVAAVVLFVCVAVYLNWSYQRSAQTDVGKTLGSAALVDGGRPDPLLEQDAAAPSAEAPAGDYFASARLNRQQARDSALAILQDTAGDGDADPTVKEQVGAAIQTMASSTQTEAQIENLVLAKGYRDCVAFIGEDSVSVVVQSDGTLTDVDTARIADIVQQTSGYSPDRIRIIEVP